MTQSEHFSHDSEQPLLYRQVSLNKILHSIQAGNCCRVLGPRYRFKSKLMRAAAAMLRENGTHYTVYQSLVEIQLNSEPSFFASLYAKIESELGPTHIPVEDYPGSAFEFQHTLISLINQSDRNLAVFIDDLEIAPPNLVALLLGTLRAVFMTVIDQPGAHFQAVVCGSLSLSQVALASASRFENISDLVLVDDLDEIERLALAQALCQEAEIAPTPKALQTLLDQTGGDLSLIKRILAICFERMKRTGRQKLTPACVTETIEFFLNGPPDWIVIEALRQIESNPSLLSCALKLLRRGEVPAAKLPIASNETPTVLDLCGMFSQIEGNVYKIKCKLWSRVLRQHLKPARVGGLYAIAGYWQQAINYLGQAVQAGQHEVKSELFTATINAMHGSENTLLAFGYLARGLQEAFPDCELLMYHRTHEALELVYPQKRHKYTARIPMSDLDCPEIEALDGPDYSIVSFTSEPCYLLPLRTSSNAPAIGLVSLNNFNLKSQLSPHQQREEILQLTSVLHQAARAIETKDQIIDLLNIANERADKIKTLNSILTGILRNQEYSEETILHLTLAGVTLGWGLGFNRAILFMSDENRQMLLGRLGIGHLTRQEAEADWDTFPHPTLEALIDFLMTHQVEEKPLHQMIQHLAFPLESTQDNLLIQSFNRCEPMVYSQQPLWATLPEALVKIVERPQEFALIPLRAANQTLGILYVDDKFTERPITPERFELLQTFINQAALALENARALETEKKQTNILAWLLRVEEAINDQTTKSVKKLFEEVVHSACQLISAECAVLYPLYPDKGKGRYIYENEQVAYWGTKQAITPSDKPRSSGGMAAWIIQKGLVHIPDVQAAPPAPDGRRTADSPFIAREKIQTFVGVRLGPIEEPVGILYINWRSPHTLTHEELTIVEIFANFVSAAIPSARRYQQVKANLKRRTQELEGLSRVFYAGLEFRSEEEIEKAIQQALQTAREFTDMPHLYLIRDESHGLWTVFQLTPSGQLYSERKERLPAGICREAFIQAESKIMVDSSPELENFPDRRYPDSRSGLALPVKVTQHCLAVLYLESPEPYNLTTEQEEFLEHLANRLALTLEQAELSQALRQLLDISLQLIKEISLRRVLVSVVDRAMDAMRAVDAITLYYVERESGQLVLGHMAGVCDEKTIGEYLPRVGRVIDHVWKSDTPIFAENVIENELLNGPFVRREAIKSAAAFPLKVGEERVGCMFFSYRFRHTFDKGEKSLLNLFAQSAAFAILRASLYNEAERHRRRLETVATIVPTIIASLELDDVFRKILREVKQAIPRAQNACIVQRDEATQEIYNSPISLEFYQVDQPPLHGLYKPDRSQRSGIAGRVMQTGQSAIISDVAQDSDYIRAITSTRSELCVPIKIGGETQAALVLESDHLNAFTPDDQRLLEMLADHVAIAIQNAQRYTELEMAKEELQRARERELRERIATLATGLIHDISKAVANIPDLVSEIKRKSQSGDSINAPLADLQKNAEETDRISSRLRDFVITGRFEPKLSKLEPLIEKAINVTLDQKPAHINLQYRGNGSDAEIMVDGLWIELLLQNLIVNAMEAIPFDQTGVVEIEVMINPVDVKIQVKDNGEGIVPGNLARIFEAGFTTKKDYGRLHGIGLYHCQQIVKEHHGDLRVDSIPEVGTIFTVTLPRVQIPIIS